MENERREKHLVIWYDQEKDETRMRLFVYLQAAMHFMAKVESGAPTLYECQPVRI